MSEIVIKGRVVGKQMQYKSGKNYIVFPLQLTEPVEFSVDKEETKDKIDQLGFILIVCPFLCWVSKEHIIRVTGTIRKEEGFFFIMAKKVYSNFWKFSFSKKFDESLD